MKSCEAEILSDIARVVCGDSDRRVIAKEVLSSFHRLVPYAAASIQMWNPLTRRHETLASRGYPESAVVHLDTWFVEHDEAYRFMRDVDPRPLRWRDMPFDYRKLHSATAFWIPLGFDEGVTTCLYDGCRRYTGNLHLNTDSRRHPTDDAMGCLRVLQHLLAPVTNPLRDLRGLVDALEPGADATLVSADGAVTALRDRSDDDDDSARLPLIQLVRQSARRPQGAAFLWRDRAGDCHRIRLMGVDRDVLIVDKRQRPPRRLTPREIDILTLLARGHSNREIGAELGITPKTVAKHVEHLLEKLCCSSRAGLAARAVADGLLWLDLEPREYSM